VRCYYDCFKRHLSGELRFLILILLNPRNSDKKQRDPFAVVTRNAYFRARALTVYRDSYARQKANALHFEI
jgi:hypothetical protein